MTREEKLRSALNKVAAASLTYNHVLRTALRYDGIEEDATFAILSHDNPHMANMNEAAAFLQQAHQERDLLLKEEA